MSATVNESLSKPKDIVPIVGCKVVNSQWPTLGLALEIALNKVDFPAFGNPTRPKSAKSFNSNKKCPCKCFLPFLQNLGFLTSLVKKCMFPNPPVPPFKSKIGAGEGWLKSKPCSGNKSPTSSSLIIFSSYFETFIFNVLKNSLSLCHSSVLSLSLKSQPSPTL
ncbi:hypothetical protein WICMUC_003447 [Wickerhamomyces mucosus]|uniref:Uncharacterized protein n=1 Tax=Wickerhamomyces mucosus TaxID=1378264 RepID=A0A9P8PMH1_9ASCO|nr:hypothetical protein WICMUC_003447 [Wickerhamomyces mucosus]